MVKRAVTSIGLALLLFITLLQYQIASAGNSDPSTIINVYPSLESIKKGSAPPATEEQVEVSEEPPAATEKPEAEEDEEEEDSEALPMEDFDDCNFDKKGSCASASNVKSAWMTKNVQKDKKAAKKAKFMKGEVEASPFGIDSKPMINTETTSKMRKLHEHIDVPAKTTHNWSEYQGMLQQLKKLKH